MRIHGAAPRLREIAKGTASTGSAPLPLPVDCSRAPAAAGPFYTQQLMEAKAKSKKQHRRARGFDAGGGGAPRSLGGAAREGMQGGGSAPLARRPPPEAATKKTN